MLSFNASNGARKETANTPGKMLPMIASLVMGGLSKQTGGGQRLQDDSAGDLLGGLLGGGDGIGLGDLAGMAS